MSQYTSELGADEYSRACNQRTDLERYTLLLELSRLLECAVVRLACIFVCLGGATGRNEALTSI